jgi:hypothetical protein
MPLNFATLAKALEVLKMAKGQEGVLKDITPEAAEAKITEIIEKLGSSPLAKMSPKALVTSGFLLGMVSAAILFVAGIYLGATHLSGLQTEPPSPAVPAQPSPTGIHVPSNWQL